jgi:hypothetical protein
MVISAKGSATTQGIEELRARHKALDEQRITAKANLKTSQDSLQDLKKQARDTYGTDDVEELRKLLVSMKEENEQKRAGYQRHLDEIEHQLTEVEKLHADAASEEPPA